MLAMLHTPLPRPQALYNSAGPLLNTAITCICDVDAAVQVELPQADQFVHQSSQADVR